MKSIKKLLNKYNDASKCRYAKYEINERISREIQINKIVNAYTVFFCNERFAIFGCECFINAMSQRKISIFIFDNAKEIFFEYLLCKHSRCVYDWIKNKQELCDLKFVLQ